MLGGTSLPLIKKRNRFMWIVFDLVQSNLIEYLEGPAARWDVDAKYVAQIDKDEDNPSPNAGSVGIPLDDIAFNLGDDVSGSGRVGGVVLSEAQTYMDRLDDKYHTL
jgi:hypothetical protein